LSAKYSRQIRLRIRLTLGTRIPPNAVADRIKGPRSQ
jgi:hypothetical protein